MREIKKAVMWLKSIRNDDCGWGDLNGAPSKIVNTAEAVLGIIISGDKDFKYINGSLEYLAKAIMGGQCQKTRQYCWATLALLSANNPSIFKEAILKSVTWLLTTQNKNGGWGRFKNDDSRIYSTSLALQTLVSFKNSNLGINMPPNQINQIPEAIEHGIVWLISVQNEDGGWGFQEGEISNAGATSHAILALQACSKEKAQRNINNGKNWLLKTQKSDGAWAVVSEHEIVNNKKYDFRHFSTPWAIIALLKLGMKITDENMQKAIEYLIELQDKYGGWKTSRESYPFIWATHNAILALLTVKEYFHPVKDIAPLLNKIEEIQKEKEEIKHTIMLNRKEIVVLSEKFKFISSKNFLKITWFTFILFCGIIMLPLYHLINEGHYILTVAVILILLGVISTIYVRKIYDLSWPVAVGLIFTIVSVVFSIITSVVGLK